MNEFGINKIIGDIRIVEITPIRIMGKTWMCVGFEEKNENKGDSLHLALVLNAKYKLNCDLVQSVGEILRKEQKILLRIHSECILGDTLFSGICDCGKQLYKSFKMINKDNKGIILYLRQEGRGIGLRNKLSCLSLQVGYLNGRKISRTYTSDEANLELGFPIDNRKYDSVVHFLKILGIKSVRLISGNPDKIKTLKHGKVRIDELIDIPRYKLTKRELQEIKEKISRDYYYPQFDSKLPSS